MEQMKKLVGLNVNNYVGVSEVYTPTQTPVYRGLGSDSKSTGATIKMNARGKVRIICFFAVLSLLAFLYIYNFIAMSNLRTNIAGMEQSIQNEQSYVNELKMKINQLSSEDSIMERVAEAGFSADVALNENPFMVEVPDVEIKEGVAQTNWFNDFCNFISAIIGG